MRRRTHCSVTASPFRWATGPSQCCACSWSSGGIPVSKDALMEAAWAGLTVEESNLAVQIAALRRGLGEEPGGEDWIETLPRRGYRFVGPASIGDQGAVTAASQAGNFPMAAGSSNPMLPDRPSIAVLPFQNIS